MDKLFKFIKGEKKASGVERESEVIKEPIVDKPNIEQIKEHPKNEILFINTAQLDNVKKHEGFYYKKYINDITKLKIVIINNSV
jgi:hypothetical protein